MRLFNVKAALTSILTAAVIITSTPVNTLAVEYDNRATEYVDETEGTVTDNTETGDTETGDTETVDTATGDSVSGDSVADATDDNDDTKTETIESVEDSQDGTLNVDVGAGAEFTVKFMCNGSELSDKRKKVTVGEKYGANNTPLPEPYTGETYCQGWYLYPDGDIATLGQMIDRNTIVSAAHDLDSDGVIVLYAHMAKRTTAVRILGTSLSLGGNIELNYYLSFPEILNADRNTRVVIWDNTSGTSKTYLAGNCAYGTEDGMDVYKFTFPLSAKNMADRLVLKVYASNGDQQSIVNSYGSLVTGNAFEYSVYDYINAVQSSTSSAANMTKLKALTKALKIYGDHSRVYFEYNASGVNPDMSSISSFDGSTFSGFQKSVTGALPAGITYSGSTLALKSGTAIRHYFKLDAGKTISDYTFKVNGESVSSGKIVEKDGLYYVEVASVAAQYGGYAYSLAVSDTAESSTLTINYSALSYVYSVFDKNAGDSLKNVCKAFYAYYIKAVDYFGDPGSGSYVDPTNEAADNRFDETNLIITNGRGNKLTGWVSAVIDGRTYKFYSDPATCKVVTGFNCIDGNLYYFGQTISDVGRMKTGFFTTASDSERKYGKDYYNETSGESNRYFADHSSGILRQEAGWVNMTAKQQYASANTYKSEQVWSYYFAPNLPADTLKADVYTSGVKTEDGISVRSKAVQTVSGGVFIKGDGNVVTLKGLGISDSDIAADDYARYKSAAASAGLSENNYYRFNKVSGARDRAVMYFYGNYYGWGSGYMWDAGDPNGSPWSYVDSNQRNTIKSLALWTNSDTKMEDYASDFLIVNGENDMVPYEVFGKFPMASTSYEGAANDRQNQSLAFRYERTNRNAGYEQDIVKGFTYNAGTGKYEFTPGRDGNVDVYDTMSYSYDRYKDYISKYGHRNLVLMGASSGAGICVSLLMLANANGDSQPDRTLLLSPWLDVSMTVGKPSVNGNSNTDLGTLRYWGGLYTRDTSYTGYDLTYSGHSGPGMKYWLASPVYGFKGVTTNSYTAADSYGSFAGLNNIYMYVGSDDPCKAACGVFYDKVKAADSGANIVNWVLGGNNGCGHGFMFKGNTRTADVIRDVAAKIMMQ